MSDDFNPAAMDDDTIYIGTRKYVAADRIEELEANINLKADFIDATLNQLAASDQRIEELEVNLAKAVEALDLLALHASGLEKQLTEDLFHQDFCGEGVTLTCVRATLAELKGEKDE
jgi:hypothetical protein